MYYKSTCIVRHLAVTARMATTTVNIRLPKEVIDILDRLVARKLFSNRSEAIREFCREYLESKEGG